MAKVKAKAKKVVRKAHHRAILAVDPGASAGVALFVDGKYVASRACVGSRYRTLASAIEDIVQVVFEMGIPPEHRLCVIEDGFGKGISAKTLDRRRGLALAAAEVAGFPEVVYVYPAEWHARMFTSRVSEEIKNEAILWCQRNLKVTPETHDQAEAACLAWYVAVDER